MKIRAVVFLICLALALPTLAEKSPIKPGKWEVSMQMDMPNLPIKMPPIKINQCITPEDAADPEKSLPKNNDPNKKNDCKVTDMKIKGNTITYSVVCPKDNVQLDAEMTYNDDSFNGTMKMKMEGMEGMTTKYTGKRLGDCDAKK